MKKALLILIILTSVISFSTTALAGWGECKRCYCDSYDEDDDGLCECGHGYGSHRA